MVAPTDGVIIFEGEVIITNRDDGDEPSAPVEPAESPEATAFVLSGARTTAGKSRRRNAARQSSISAEEQHELVLQDWTLVEWDDFAEPDAVDGWSYTVTTQCGEESLLGGHCALGNGYVSKEFILPKHVEVRVEASVHFINEWSGQDVRLSLNEVPVWSRTVDSAEEHNADICGGHLFEESGDPVFVEVEMQEDSKTLRVSFSADGLDDDPCVQSWALEDVKIYAK